LQAQLVEKLAFRLRLPFARQFVRLGDLRGGHAFRDDVSIVFDPNAAVLRGGYVQPPA
jgi:hypothetical protein